MGVFSVELAVALKVGGNIIAVTGVGDFFVGQDGITHLSATQRLGFSRTETATNQTYDDVIELIGQGERSVETTVFSNVFLLREEMEDDPRTQLFPPWEELPSGSDERPTDPDCESDLYRNATTFKRIVDNGGKVLVGTDAPLNTIGIGVHTNLRPLVYYGGFSPDEALLAATRVPAEHQGVADDLGTLEPDKLADMVFVDGNPLERIEDAMNVKMTMKNGELFTIEDLIAPFADESQTKCGSDRDGDLSNLSGPPRGLQMCCCGCGSEYHRP